MESTFMESIRGGVGSGAGRVVIGGMAAIAIFSSKTYMTGVEDRAVERANVIMLASLDDVADAMMDLDNLSVKRDDKQAQQIEKLSLKMESNREEQKADLQRFQDQIIQEIHRLHD
tara:strand:- start:200 stop:547 length:348 start_codon:yes stop_codon:yes gene_type:complete